MTNTTLPNRDQTATLESLNPLFSNHYKELIEKRSLLLDWVLANCRSVTIEQASEALGYPSKSAGILLQGDGWQIQFKPDQPWLSARDTSAGKKRSPKYRSPQEYDGKYDAMLPSHPSDKTYWWDIDALKERAYKVNGHPCLLVTEGMIKAIAGCSYGLPTIALLGVEMGLTSSKADPQGKRYLVPSLERLIKAGFGFIIAFDADCITNKNVLEAQKRLAQQLKMFGVPVYSITGKWNMEDGKGLDDFIQQSGIESFKKVLSEIVDQYEAPADELPKDKKPPTPKQLAAELAEEYKQRWKFHNEQKTWRIFTGKIWEETEHNVFMQHLQGVVDAKGIDYNSPAYLKNTEELLKWKLLERKWLSSDRKNWIAFNNGVLQVETGKLHKHSPGFLFTSHLQRDYRPLTFATEPPSIMQLLADKCPVFYDWAMYAMNNDESKVLKLLAMVNGVIKFRFYDLQMFIYLMGKPGTGKGTFLRLLGKVVGEVNVKSSRLDKLSKDEELARIIDAQLVVCPDEDKQIGNFAALKALTGGDLISFRQLYKEGGNAYFYGTLAIAANFMTFAGNTIGVPRRTCASFFQNKIPAHKRSAAIEELLEDELTELTSVALHIPDDQVTRILRGTEESEIPEFKQESWLLRCQVDSIAAWINDRIIYDPTSTEIIQELFADYEEFCSESRQKPFTLQNFSINLIQVCQDILGWNDVSKGRSKNVRIIKGVRLRKRGFDDHIPVIEDTFLPIKAVEAETVVNSLLRQPEANLDANLDANLKALQIKDDANSANLLPKLSEENIPLSIEEQEEPQENNSLFQVGEAGILVNQTCSAIVLTSPSALVLASTPLVVEEANLIEVTPEEPQQPTQAEPQEVTADEPQQVTAAEVDSVLPLYWWVRINDVFAQVTAHHSHGIFFVSEDKSIYGVYRNYQPLTTTEMLQEGLRWNQSIERNE